MIAVDTNILVYAHRRDSPFHDPARACVEELAAGPGRWAIPWPCLHEFLAVVTSPRVFRQPTPLEDAMAVVAVFRNHPRCELLAEGEAHFELLSAQLRLAKAAGGQIHDARIAALCLGHGVRELWTADRDFSRFPALRVRNPLIA